LARSQPLSTCHLLYLVFFSKVKIENASTSTKNVECGACTLSLSRERVIEWVHVSLDLYGLWGLWGRL